MFINAKGFRSSKSLVGEWGVFFLFFLLSVFVLNLFNDWKPYLFYEDNLFEWYQVSLLFSSALLIKIFSKYYRSQLAPLIMTWSMVCLFIALEELSFGQRIFSINTPIWLAKFNSQGELNIHNMGVEFFFPVVLSVLCMTRVLLSSRRNRFGVVCSMGGALTTKQACKLLFILVFCLAFRMEDEIFETIIYSYLFWVFFKHFTSVVEFSINKITLRFKSI